MLLQANIKIASLEKSNQDIINQNDVIIAETEYLQYETRVNQMTNILSRLSITDQERKKLLQTLVNSDLTIEFIEETYQPIITTTKKNNISIVETKLPQKSTPTADKTKEFSYYT